jgi:hypothetical protein
VHPDVEARTGGHVDELPIAVVSIDSGASGRRALERPAVEKEEIVVAVTVRIEEGDAASHRFGKVLLPRAPLSCLNATPAAVVTSTSRTGTDGDADTGFGRGTAAA